MSTTCTQCGRPLPENAKFCTACGALTPPSGISFAPPPPNPPSAPLPYDAAPPPQYYEPGIAPALAPPSNAPVNSEQEPSNPYAKSAMRRYRSAYRIARLICLIGICIQVFGLCSAAWLILYASLITHQIGLRASGFSVSALIGLGVFILWFLIGLIIRASGEKMKVKLDGAVVASPFMSFDEKAKAMSL